MFNPPLSLLESNSNDAQLNIYIYTTLKNHINRLYTFVLNLKFQRDGLKRMKKKFTNKHRLLSVLKTLPRSDKKKILLV